MNLLVAVVPFLTAFSDGKIVHLNCNGTFLDGSRIPEMRVALNESVSTIKLDVESADNSSDWIKADYKSDSITAAFPWKNDTLIFKLNRINGKFVMNEVPDGFAVEGECLTDKRIRKF